MVRLVHSSPPTLRRGILIKLRLLAAPPGTSPVTTFPTPSSWNSLPELTVRTTHIRTVLICWSNVVDSLHHRGTTCTYPRVHCAHDLGSYGIPLSYSMGLRCLARPEDLSVSWPPNHSVFGESGVVSPNYQYSRQRPYIFWGNRYSRT